MLSAMQRLTTGQAGRRAMRFLKPELQRAVVEMAECPRCLRLPSRQARFTTAREDRNTSVGRDLPTHSSGRSTPNRLYC